MKKSFTGSNKVLTENFAEPLNGMKSATFDIKAGDGNLTIDRLINSEQELASGTLQYSENQSPPTRGLISSNDRATFTLSGSSRGRPWLHLPWAACNGATEWQIHLNPAVSSEIIAHSDGGNLKLNLAGMTVTHISADTGGGNIEVILPDRIADLSVSARTGGGNVTFEIEGDIKGSNIVNAKSGAGDVSVLIPSGIAARIQATTGLGKAIVDPRFSKIDKSTFQSPDFDHAADKLEITVSSGAGNVIVNTK